MEQYEELKKLLNDKETIIAAKSQKIPMPPEGRIVYPNKWWSDEQIKEYWDNKELNEKIT